MQSRLFALLLTSALIAAGCVSTETKPEPAAAPATAQATSAPPSTTAAAPAPAKPECAAEPAAKKPVKKGSKTAKKPAAKNETAAKTDTAAADCVPATPKADAASAKAVDTKAESAAPAGAGIKLGSDCKPCTVKSRDGSFDGEVYGNIPANSKWAKLRIGMLQPEVERILGSTSNIRGYVTAKAFIPFYFGTDSHRYEAVYAGQGSVAFTGGSWGGGQGVLMMINYDPKIQ